MGRDCREGRGNTTRSATYSLFSMSSCFEVPHFQTTNQNKPFLTVHFQLFVAARRLVTSSLPKAKATKMPANSLQKQKNNPKVIWKYKRHQIVNSVCVCAHTHIHMEKKKYKKQAILLLKGRARSKDEKSAGWGSCGSGGRMDGNQGT